MPLSIDLYCRNYSEDYIVFHSEVYSLYEPEIIQKDKPQNKTEVRKLVKRDVNRLCDFLENDPLANELYNKYHGLETCVNKREINTRIALQLFQKNRGCLSSKYTRNPESTCEVFCQSCNDL